MKRVELDAIKGAALLDLPADTPIEEFAREDWKRVWVDAVERWFEDGGAWYDYVMNGFKGWAERTDFEIYCDLRFTYIEEKDAVNEGLGEILRPVMMEKKWDALYDQNRELGQFS